MTTIILTSGSSWTVPSDWNNASNIIECIAGGGGGGCGAPGVGGQAGMGGGGGAYSKLANLALTPGANVPYAVGGGGTGVNAPSFVGVNGNAGGHTWFNGSTFGGASVAAAAGGGGSATDDGAGNFSGGGGGQASSCIGTTKFSGGDGGNIAGLAGSSTAGTGGGGAGGPNGNGVSGGSASPSAGSVAETAGGSGDAGAGGAGGGSSGGAGGTGTEWGAAGSGGGGGGGRSGGIGGAYGGGGGGIYPANGGTTSGAGRQGVIVITYTPSTGPPPSGGGTIILTSGSSWTVPSNWNNAKNTIECIGGGGGGARPNVGISSQSNSGGGGAYSKLANLALTPGANVSFQVGAGGLGATVDNGSGAAGGDTWFNNTSTVLAKGGTGGTPVAAAGVGGQASAGVGTTKYSGGNAGGGSFLSQDGAGGAAGPYGPGGNGGPSNGGWLISDAMPGGGGGGGGAAGSTDTHNGGTGNGGNGANASGLVAGTGGAAAPNTSTNGGNGTSASGSSGGGGGGGRMASAGNGVHGGNGGAGTEWDSTHGSGGGAGGSNQPNSGGGSRGGDGGLYGGGGGNGSYGPAGTGNGGNGAQGLIVITYSTVVDFTAVSLTTSSPILDQALVGNGHLLATSFAPTSPEFGTPLVNGTVIDSNTVLLLHMDAALPLPFTDSPGRGHVASASGNARVWAQAGYFGACGGYFDGTPGSHIALDASSDFAFGSGDFTIELFVYLIALPASGGTNWVIYDARPGGANGLYPLIYFNSTSSVRLIYQDATGAGAITSTTVFAANTWYHVAVTRASGTTRMFVNGALQAGPYADSIVYAAGLPWICEYPGGGANVNGFTDEIRISKGVARYTTTFTIPSAPFTTDANTVLLLHCDGPQSFPDSSPSHHTPTFAGNPQIAATTAKFGGACGYFDADETPGSRPSLDGSIDFAFGTGDFTIDFWMLPTAFTSNGVLYEGRNASTPNNAVTLYITASDKIIHAYLNNVGAIDATTALVTYNWYHVALTRSAGVTRLFLNGIQEGASYADATNYSAAAGTPYIGDYFSIGGSPFRGFLDEVRASKGVARWTSTFAPPTAPYGGYAFTALPLVPAAPVFGTPAPIPAIDPACVLLLHFNGANGATSFIDTSGHNHTVTRNGNALISTAQPEFGGSAGAFDGATSTNLTLDGGGDFAFGTGDFTIDFWVQFRTTAANVILYDGRAANGDISPTPALYFTSGHIQYYANGNDRIIGTTTLAAGVWYHIALARSGTSTKLFLNGAQEGATYTDTNNYSNPASRPIIASAPGGAGATLDGYIDELEVLTGKARWTQAFAPPLAPYRYVFAPPVALVPASPVLGGPALGTIFGATNLAIASPEFGTPLASDYAALIAIDLVTASPTLGLAASVGQLFALDLEPFPTAIGAPLFVQLHYLIALDLAPLPPVLDRADRVPPTPPIYPANMDRHVRRSGGDYAQALIDLLPRGQAWPRDPGSTLIKALTGLAAFYGFVDGRAADLLERESDPRETFELLPGWERNWGLPDERFPPTQTLGQRQAMLVLKMTLLGGQARSFFLYIAQWLGYSITISEYAPFMAGVSRVGDTRTPPLDPSPLVGDFRWYIGPPEMRFYWTVHVGSAGLTWFRATRGQAGVDPHLLIGLAIDLECLLRRWKPAHTEIIFDYSNLKNGDPMSGTP